MWIYSWEPYLAYFSFYRSVGLLCLSTCFSLLYFPLHIFPGSIWVTWHVVLCLTEPQCWKATVHAFCVGTPKLHLRCWPTQHVLFPQRSPSFLLPFLLHPHPFWYSFKICLYFPIFLCCESSQADKGNFTFRVLRIWLALFIASA